MGLFKQADKLYATHITTTAEELDPTGKNDEKKTWNQYIQSINEHIVFKPTVKNVQLVLGIIEFETGLTGNIQCYSMEQKQGAPEDLKFEQNSYSNSPIPTKVKQKCNLV